MSSSEFSFFAIQPHRVRVEWSTRDAINQRYNEDEKYPKKVTSSMLLEHPTRGISIMKPIFSRDDTKRYSHSTEYFPNAKNSEERPRLPPRQLIQNPWFVDNETIIQDLKGVVKEQRSLVDIDTLMAERTWRHRWIPQRK